MAWNSSACRRRSRCKVAAAGAGRTRRPTRRQGASRGRGESAGGLSSGLRWYAGGLASGMFLSFMFYLVTLPPSESAGGGRSGDAIATADATAEQQPRFDFFEMLPQQRIEVEVEPEAMPD